MTDYQLIKQLVDEMNVGEIKTIDKPENVDNFRSYLSIVSYKQQKRFSTKVSGDKMLVKRIKKEKAW